MTSFFIAVNILAENHYYYVFMLFYIFTVPLGLSFSVLFVRWL